MCIWYEKDWVNEKYNNCKKHDYDLNFMLVSILRFFSSDNLT